MNKPTEPTDLNDPAARAALLLRHPLMTGAELLVTPPIRDLYLAVKRAVFLHESGRCFSAPAGTGKTCALRVAAKMLSIQIPNIVVIQHDTQNTQSPSIRAFFQHFLDTIKHPELKGETYPLRRRVTRGLLYQAQRSGLDMVVLLVDEAQAMTILDFTFLKDLDNSLDDEKIRMVTILAGEAPKFSGRIDQLEQQNNAGEIGRFTRNHSSFRAYSTLDDITQILDGIDNSIYPVNGGWPWTRFFFPKAYASGFRMRNEASNFWFALKESTSATKGSDAYPARAFFIAIRAFMLDNCAADSENLCISPDAWRAAIDYARMKEATISMGAGDTKDGVEVET